MTLPSTVFEEAVDASLAAGREGDRGDQRRPRRDGAEGRAREEAVVERVREAGAVLLGPNCLGVFDAGADIDLASNSFAPGEIGLISQSGNLAIEIGLLAGGRRASASPASPRSGTRPTSRPPSSSRASPSTRATRVIAVYCEDFRDGRAFAEAARGAVRRASRCSSSRWARPRRAPRGPLPHGRARVGASPPWTQPAARPGSSASRARGSSSTSPRHSSSGQPVRGRRVAVCGDGGRSRRARLRPR